jgi:hypothetical protein
MRRIFEGGFAYLFACLVVRDGGQSREITAQSVGHLCAEHACRRLITVPLNLFVNIQHALVRRSAAV